MQEMIFCQYCGEKEKLEINKYNDEYAVHCQHCGSIGPMAKDEEFAILKWNDRILEAPEMPQENQVACPCDDEEDDFYYCPIMNNPCIKNRCMMFVYTETEEDGTDWGRCGLVNTIFINSTGCGGAK